MSEISNETLHQIQIRIEDKLIEIAEHLRVQNGRIRKLENWRNYIMGGSIVVNAIIVPLVLKMFLER